MHSIIETKYKMKKEIIVALAGVLLLTAVFIFLPGEMRSSSPFALFLIVVAGFLLALKFELPGGIFLFFGGAALAVHPLLFTSSYWLLPGGVVTAFSGSIIFLKWWEQGEQ